MRGFAFVINSYFVCVPQPQLTDEEGWKRFCLGETVYLGTPSCQTDAEPALDYSKVLRMCVCVMEGAEFLMALEHCHV